jgi:hypothetical protein
MSKLSRLRFLAASRVVLALSGVAAGCGGDSPTDFPDASRDRIVFVSDASGNYDIYAIDQDGGNRVQLTSATTLSCSRRPARMEAGSPSFQLMEAWAWPRSS